jgi:isopropylmalate/homocitrate/citramalate synthase
MKCVVNPYILDSTLREGELFRVFPQNSRIRIAELLAKTRIKYVEVTLAYPPRTNPEELKELIKTIKDNGSYPVIHARAFREDFESLIDYEADSCAFYIAVSNLHRNYKLHGLTFEEALSRLIEACDFAKKHGFRYIRATLEDTSRLFIEGEKNSLEKVIKSIEELRQSGATVVSLPDTSGLMSPELVKNFFSSICNVSTLPVAAHFHNDYGLASSNTVQAALSGAKELHCTVMGIGDRNGIADLYEVCSVLEDIHGIKTGLERNSLSFLYNEFSKLSRISIPWRHPLSYSARTIRAGVHQSMTVKRPDGYIPSKKLEYDFKSPVYAVSPFISHRVVEELLSRHNVNVSSDKAREIAEHIASATRKGRAYYLVSKLIHDKTGVSIREEEIASFFGKERCYILLRLRPQLDAGEIISFLNSLEDVEFVDEVYGDADMIIHARIDASFSLIREIKQKFSSGILEMKVLVTD